MNKLYMGIDVGGISAKGVIIDEYDNIMTSSYMYTYGNPIKATKKIIKEMQEAIDLDKYRVVSVGTTGSARKLIGTMLSAETIKNEITASAVGTIKLYPSVKTIIDIGGEDSKITLVNNGVVTDYAINTLCSASTGSFIDSLAKRLDIKMEDISNIALSSTRKLNVPSRCTIFAGNDLINKIQSGYNKADVIAAACHMITINYLNNVAKGKKIQKPIVFNGGVSKNIAILKSFEDLTGEKITVNKNSHLMGAFGIAIMARESKKEKVFDFNIDNYKIETKITSCNKCSNNCDVVTIYRNDKMIDYWGNRCNKINISKKKTIKST